MADLVERYVHQVGLYLPHRERAEIEAELRSQIQDQLDDRYQGAPSPAEVSAVLAELGRPRRIAASYSSQRYLVGPDLYPYMLLILRYGWLLVPAVVVFLRIFAALTSAQAVTLSNLVIEPVLAALQATLIFSGVVVLIFALIQHSGADLNQELPFNPLELPEVDDPGVVDRFEVVFGVVLGVFIILIFLYWLRVGGLTLRFDLSNPGDMIPIPTFWMILLIVNTVVLLIIHLLALRRKRWSVGSWLVGTVLEVFGTICLYFVVYKPVFERIAVANPALTAVPWSDLPALIAVITAVGSLISRGSKLVKLWSYGSTSTRPHLRIDG